MNEPLPAHELSNVGFSSTPTGQLRILPAKSEVPEPESTDSNFVFFTCPHCHQGMPLTLFQCEARVCAICFRCGSHTRVTMDAGPSPA